ncbi:YpoC family protein [Fictibacillus sp. NPDC058756]|uniref:YpoC family protein n=1 Tax=Fictibacillus sp. NPDC058756 TaxID=3346625 RepID=UPI003678BF1A
MEQYTEQLTEIFKEWKEKSPFIADCFKNRDRNKAKEPMIYFFHQFLKVLFCGNRKMVDEQALIIWKESVKELDRLPVNAIERLSFIKEQPDHYQSFIQLSELFSEWEKKSVILLKRKT